MAPAARAQLQRDAVEPGCAVATLHVERRRRATALRRGRLRSASRTWHGARRAARQPDRCVRPSARSRERLDRVMPALFAAAADSSAPERCLVRLIGLVHAVARRSAYLALLDEQPVALKRLTDVFAASALLADRVIAHPLLLDELFDDRVERPRRRIAKRSTAEIRAPPRHARRTDPEARDRDGPGSSGWRRSSASASRFSAGASMRCDAPVRSPRWPRRTRRGVAHRRTRSGCRAWTHRRPRGEGAGMAVIGYGSLGGSELGFGSDLDLVFLYDGRSRRSSNRMARKPLEGARYYARLAQRFVHLLTMLTRAGPTLRNRHPPAPRRRQGSAGHQPRSLCRLPARTRLDLGTPGARACPRRRRRCGARSGASPRPARCARDAPRDRQRVRARSSTMRARWRNESDRSDARAARSQAGRTARSSISNSCCRRSCCCTRSRSPICCRAEIRRN